jgi:hypothetical protein
MTDERKDEAPAASAEEWPKRAPPTIDLDASDVSGDTRRESAARAFAKGAGEKMSAAGSRLRTGVLPKLVAPLSGGIAALLVFAALWGAGLTGQPQIAQPSVAPAQFDNVAANVGDLTARLARVETATAKPPPPPATDPALAGRTEALEKSLATARDEVGRLSTQLRNVTSQLNDVRAMPRDGSAPAPDFAPLNERLTRLEDATKALSVEFAKPAPVPIDDSNVRRLVVANTLDAAVRRGEPFTAALAAAKQVAASPATLAPLDAFAAKGIPSEAAYLRDIVPVLQRIADANAAGVSGAPASGGSGVLDRLQSGLAKLVRVERDAGPVLKDHPSAPATSVRRDDLAATRQDVAKLPQSADPQIQAWIKQVDAREAALAAARKFSAEALAALSKSGQ